METPEPFNIFSRRIDVRGVISACRSVASDVRVVGPDDAWSEVTLLGPKKAFRKRQQLRISHDASFYDGPDWAQYVLGMTNYIAGFAAVPARTEILRAVESFRFILGFPDFDLSIAGNDERVAWVHAICRQLDGVIFTPSMLLDSCGRLLVSVDGRFDPAAVLPRVPSRDDHPEADDFSHHESQHPATPPTAGRVARRAIVLAALGNRGLMEHDANSLEDPEETRLATLGWIRQSGVADELEPEEWEALQRPLGSLDSRATINAVWRLEGAGVLLWTLGLYELPPYDQLVNPGEIFAAVGIFDVDAARDIVANARLRSSEELASYANHATMANWRFRNFSLRPVAVDFVAASKDCWIGTFDITRFRIAANDVMIGEFEISQADSASVQMCRSLAQERHLAINWIQGGSEIYSKTDTST